MDRVERLLSDAIASGDFDDLPGAGRPIPGLSAGDDPGWWARARMEEERDRERVAAARHAVRDGLGEILLAASEAEARRRADRLSETIGAVNSAGGGRVIPPLDVDQLLLRRRRMRRRLDLRVRTRQSSAASSPTQNGSKSPRRSST